MINQNLVNGVFCFISNYEFTPLQSEIAKALKLKGIEILWITVNERWRNFLAENGWDENFILHLSLGMTNEALFTKYPIKFFDILYSDRALRHTPQLGLRYVHSAAFAIDSFFKKHKPNIVIGEKTWAHERIAAQICKHHEDKLYLEPQTTRLPNGRFGFFLGEDQESLLDFEFPGQTGSHDIKISDYLTPVSYLERNNRILANARSIKSRINRLKRFCTRENIDKNDPTHIQSRLDTIATKGMQEFNRVTYRFAHKLKVDDELLQGNFVLYALHAQPESSIDVYGRYYDDQFRIIHAIWRTLPAGWNLYIKEHPNAIGDRSLFFYHKINKLVGVSLIDEKANSREIIKHAKAVFTISGTIAYESALLGRPSFTFAPMFFNKLKWCNRITIEELRASDGIDTLIRSFESEPDNNNFDVVKNSFQGKYSDVNTDPTVMDPTNLDQLVYAFHQVADGNFKRNEI